MVNQDFAIDLRANITIVMVTIIIFSLLQLKSVIFIGCHLKALENVISLFVWVSDQQVLINT